MTTAPADTSKFSPAVRFLLACAIFAVLAFIVFHDALFNPDKVLSKFDSDIWLQFYPWRQFGFDQLKAGHVALWNPYVYSGSPYVGGFQSALFYPLNVHYLFLPLRLALNLGIALHVFLCGAFMYCWAAYRRLRWVSCVVAGMVFMFGGAEFGHISNGHLSNLDTLAWAPLIFLAIDDLTTTRSLRGALLGSAAFAMQILAGHAQYAFYTAIAATIYFALNLRSAPSRRRAVGGYLLCFTVGVLLAAVQFFPGFAATTETMRSHTTMAFAGRYSFPPENLVTLALPGFFGDTDLYWGRWSWEEANAFIGVVGLVLACFGMRSQRRARRFAITMLVVIGILGLGEYTPAFWITYRLPGFSSFRAPCKFMFLFVMFLALLSGMGLDRLMSRVSKRIWPVAAIAAAAALSLLLAAVVNAWALGDWTTAWGRLVSAMEPYHDHSLRAALGMKLLYVSAQCAAGSLAAAGIIGLILAAILILGRWNRRALLAIPLLMTIELLIFAFQSDPTFSLAEYHAYIGAVARCLAPVPRESRVWTFAQGETFMNRRLNVWGDDPMISRRYALFIANALTIDPSVLMADVPPRPHRDNRLLRLVRMSGGLDLDASGAHFFKLDAPTLPRAELVGNVAVIPDRGQLIARMNDPHFDPTRTALIESPVGPMPAGKTDSGSVAVHDIDSDTLDIVATAKSPCLLVITDSYSRGWHAEALPDSDQHAYEVIPADLALRGVPLSAGHHHFRMIYRPMAYVVGKWTTLAAIVMYLLVAAVWLRRHRAKMSQRQEIS